MVCTLTNNDISHHSGQTVVTISTSNKTILAVHDQDSDTLTRAAYLHSYRQRQIGQLDCDIITNYGKIIIE